MYPYILLFWIEIEISLLFLFFWIVAFGYFLERSFQKNKISLEDIENSIMDYLLTTFFWFFIFWRIWDIITNYQSYSWDFSRIFYLWDSWINFQFWIIWIFIWLYFICFLKKEKFWKWMDTILVPILILFWIFSLSDFFSWANYWSPTSSFFWVSFDSPEVPFIEPLHPVQIYEFLWIFLISISIRFYSKIKKYDWKISSLWFFLYFWLEFILQFFRWKKYDFELLDFDFTMLIYFVLALIFLIFFILNSYNSYHLKFFEKNNY